MSAYIGDRGQRLNLLIKQGATFGPLRIRFTNPDGSPIDVRDIVFRAQLRKTPNSLVAAATFVFTTDDGADGWVSMSMSADQTANVTAGDDEFSDESAYVWDLEGQEPDGRVLSYLYGNVRVVAEVTK